MSRKILFFDIDETLMDGRTQQVPESAIEGIKKAHDKGHLIFINTGRCKFFIPACLQEIAIDGFAYGCGSHIEYQGKVLFEKFVPKDDICFLRDAMQASEMQGIFQGPRYCYFGEEAIDVLSAVREREEHRPAEKRCYENFRKFLKLYERDYHAELRSDREENMEINKLVTFRVSSCDYDTFLQKTRDKYQLIENGNGFTEILPLIYTKATCIDFLADYFQIEKRNCYVFGDSPNDLPMLTHVENSIAMGNSYQEVKDISKYVTKEIDQDGIYDALKHFSII